MTVVLPPQRPATAAPPAPPDPRRGGHGLRRNRAGAIVLVTVGVLILAALLNPDDLLKRAKAQPFGWQRDVTVRLAEINHDVSHALWLDRPRRAIDRLFGNEASRTSAGPTPTPSVSPSGGTTPTTVPSTQPTPSVSPRRPTAADPLRVYIGGDSVMQAVSDALRRYAESSKVVKPTIEFRFSTGLSRPDYFDWPGRLRDELARKPRPEAVILMFGANDVQPIMTPTGPAKTGSAAWLAEYRRRVDATMKMLSAGGVPVFWIGQPLMRSAFFTQRVNELNDIYSSEAARHSGITFVDSRPLLADAQGHYTAYLPDSSGRKVLVRTPDGVHLTDAGGDRVAAAVVSMLRKRWPLP